MTRGLPRPFWFIWAGAFVNRCGSFVLPFMAIYLTEVRHLTIARAGLVIALYGVGGMIGAPIGGWLADHLGRRATMIGSLGLGGMGMIALGSVESVAAVSVMIFAIAVVAEMYRPAMSAAIADLVPPEGRPHAYGLVYWSINLGFAVGLGVGGVLAGISFRWLFVGDGLTTIAFAFLVWLGVPESRPDPENAHGAQAGTAWAGFVAPYRDATFLRYLALHAVIWVVFMQNQTTFALDMTAHGVSKSVFGLVVGLNGLVIVLVQPVLGPLLRRFDRSRTLATGALVIGIGFGLNAIVAVAPLYALGVVIWTLGEIAVVPVGQTVVADLAPRHLRGRYQGASALAFGLATSIAPPLGTLALDRLGSVALWSGCLVLSGAVAAGHLLLGPAIRRERAARMAV